jgi:pimeloyl-ACP methyl ester carboxylesterase
MKGLFAPLLVVACALAQDPAPPRRPQTPSLPLPYETTAATVPAADGAPELAGALTRPRGVDPAPAVILVQGGSPFDRDGTLAAHKPLLVIADTLTRAGFATLRLDDRGVGGSKGNKFAATLDELAQDLARSVRFLRGQPGIRADRIGLLGHSGGALLCALLASRDRELAFVVLLGSPARPLPLLIAAQLAADGDGTIAINEQLGAAAAEVVRGTPAAADLPGRVQEAWRALLEAMPAADRQHADRFVASLTRSLPALLGPVYLRDLFCFDPSPALRSITCPVLAIWGEYDQGGKLANSSVWELARLLGQGACSDFCILQVPRTNHCMQTCATGRLDEVPRIEETVAPSILRALQSWAAARAE